MFGLAARLVVVCLLLLSGVTVSLMLFRGELISMFLFMVVRSRVRLIDARGSVLATLHGAVRCVRGTRLRVDLSSDMGMGVFVVRS